MTEAQPFPKSRTKERRGNENPECSICRRRHKPGKCKSPPVGAGIAIQVGPARLTIDDLFKEDGSPKPAPPPTGTSPGTTGDGNVTVRRAHTGPIPLFIRPGMFILAGKRLNKLTDSQDFSCDTEEAEALAEGLVAALEYHKVETRPDFLFLVMLAMWLGPGLFIHALPRMKAAWDKSFGKKKDEKPVEEIRIPPPPPTPPTVPPGPGVPDTAVTTEPGPPANPKDFKAGHASRAADPRGFQPV